MRVGVFRFISGIAIAVMITGCASSSGTRQAYIDPEYADSAFTNYLVIGVAGSYNNRAYFERSVVSSLRAHGASATAFYNVVRGNEPIDRDIVIQAVNDNGFDAVLVTRVLGQQSQIDVEKRSPDAKASTIGGRPINFFRYDYEELNEPAEINLAMTVTLVTELFSAADERMIATFETSNRNAQTINNLIESSAASIADRLARDKRIGR